MNDKWNSPQVNKQGVMTSYKDEYDDHAQGILQEDSQNGFDAYVPGTQIKDMKIEFKYDLKQRILYYRDFGTNGMTHCSECDWGIKPDGTPCTNEESPIPEWRIFPWMMFLEPIWDSATTAPSAPEPYSPPT